MKVINRKQNILIEEDLRSPSPIELKRVKGCWSQQLAWDHSQSLEMAWTPFQTFLNMLRHFSRADDVNGLCEEKKNEALFTVSFPQLVRNTQSR